MIDRVEIDFDKELTKGAVTYNKQVGQWWKQRSDDSVHDLAYRHIARKVRELVPGNPKAVLDYGCGSGNLLGRLCRQFPTSQIIGIDGSSLMLDIAREKIRRVSTKTLDRVTLIESSLPNFELAEEHKADVVIFCFPNICPAPDETPYYDKHGGKNKIDRKVCKMLSVAREEDPDMETVTENPEDMFTFMMDRKVVTRNLRSFLKKGGSLIRVEYANCRRHELTDLVTARCEFEEASLKQFGGLQPDRLFKLVSSTYRRSSVIMDVYHQTGDEGDAKGGYHVNLFKAL
jgi:SAM-dependent methyltransferase